MDCWNNRTIACIAFETTYILCSILHRLEVIASVGSDGAWAIDLSIINRSLITFNGNRGAIATALF